MTLSKEARLKDLRRVLELMLSQLGEKSIEEALFCVDDPTFAGIQPTTWKELAARYWVERFDVIGAVEYRLTGPGWYGALEASGQLSTPDSVQRMSKLAAALKDSVKGRKDDAFVFPDSLSSESGLPETWIFNAIESDLLGRRFDMKSADWQPQSRKTLIRVPIDFGMEHL